MVGPGEAREASEDFQAVIDFQPQLTIALRAALINPSYYDPTPVSPTESRILCPAYSSLSHLSP